MTTRLVERDIAGLEQTNQRWATDTEEVRTLLRRHGHALRNHRDALTGRERVSDLLEDPEDLVRDGSSIAVRAYERCFG